MHRFFLTSVPLQPNTTVDLSPLARQLHGVLRLQPGAPIVLLDNRGDEFPTQIEQIDAKRASGRVLAQQACAAEPTRQLTLYQCSLKADKFEWVLQKGTELGVARFVPVISERSVVRPASALLAKYDRWRAILREAAEQCGRGRIPELAPPMDFGAAVRAGDGVKLLAWELSNTEYGVRSTEMTDNRLDDSILRTPYSLLIGPEGGISSSEAELARTAGWQIISLGPRILRAETAALAAITLLLLGQ